MKAITPKLPSVWSDLPIVAAAQIMLGYGTHTLMVVDPSGKPVGIVTAKDLLNWDGRYLSERLETATSPDWFGTLGNRRVSDVMARILTSDLDEFEKECPPSHVKARQSEDVAKLKDEGHVGKANQTDLLLRRLTSLIKMRAEKRHDDEAIRERIFAEIPYGLWARVEGLHIDVTCGVATISGIVTDGAVRNDLRIVEGVRGVASLVDSLLLSDPVTGELLP